MPIEQVSLALFSFFSVIRLGSYLPQIVRIARDLHGAQAIACSTWTMWLLANASTALYAKVNAGDDHLAIVHTLNAVCCATVIGLTVAKRRHWRRRSSVGAVAAQAAVPFRWPMTAREGRRRS